MQTLPPRAPDLLFCTLCVAWALFSQLTPLFGFVFSPLEDFRIFKKNSCGFFYIHSDIHYLCFYKSHSQHRSRQSLGVWESQWWDLLLLHWRILVFFRFWTSYQPDRCPRPLHPGLTLFFSHLPHVFHFFFLFISCLKNFPLIVFEYHPLPFFLSLLFIPKVWMGWAGLGFLKSIWIY